jgi:hypothetical protein
MSWENVVVDSDDNDQVHQTMSGSGTDFLIVATMLLDIL